MLADLKTDTISVIVGELHHALETRHRRHSWTTRHHGSVNRFLFA
jgi:hypothetical protein